MVPAVMHTMNPNKSNLKDTVFANDDAVSLRPPATF